MNSSLRCGTPLLNKSIRRPISYAGTTGAYHIALLTIAPSSEYLSTMQMVCDKSPLTKDLVGGA